MILRPRLLPALISRNPKPLSSAPHLLPIAGPARPSSFQYLLSRQEQRSRFSTMMGIKAQADFALLKPEASVGGGREYDPEIKDIAGYVHNYKIDSDLAASAPVPVQP